MLALDHVLIAVADLDDAAAKLRDEHGLASVAGGRHAGHGTANRIVPMRECYLELIAVVDESEADASPLGDITRRRATGGSGFLGVCLRTDDIDHVAARRGLATVAMERTNARGERVGWRLSGLDRAIADALPFFIQWDDDSSHPANEPVEHREPVEGIRRVDVPVGSTELAEWIGGADLPLRAVPGAAGVIVIGVGDGEVLLP